MFVSSISVNELQIMMTDQTIISFDNTEIAFAAKSNAELKKANFLFGLMGKPLLVNAALKITPLAIKWRIPFTKTLIRKTIFKQFVGGETLKKQLKWLINWKNIMCRLF